MKKLTAIILFSIILCLHPMLPVQAADSKDKQIFTNITNGTKAVEDENYPAAYICFNKAVELDPNNALFLLFRAHVSTLMKNYDAALKDLDMALTIVPNNYLAIYNKACIYSLKNDRANALDCLQQLAIMDGRFKAEVPDDKDFDNIRQTEELQTLLGIQVFIDGTYLQSDTAPIITEGRTLVPLRAIFEAMGVAVEWEAASQRIHCRQGDTTITLQIDNNEALVNEKTVALDTPATINKNRTYVPLRFLAESLGAEVAWAAETKRVYITSPQTKPQSNIEDTQKLMDALNESLDFSIIIGSEPNSCLLKDTEGRLLLIAKSPHDLQAFQSLSEENQKIFLNDYAQANWAEFTDCEEVTIYFIFNGKRYAEAVTTYKKPSTSLILYNFELGIDTNVIIQDRDNNYFYDYYKQIKPSFNLANAITTIEEKLLPYDIYFYNIYFATIDVPETWGIWEDDASVSFLAPMDGDDDMAADNISIYINVFPSEMMEKLNDPETYKNFIEGQLGYDAENFQMESAELDSKSISCNSYIFIYTDTIDGVPVKGKSIISQHQNGRQFVFELVCEAANYEQYNEIFEAMAYTLRHDDPGMLF